MKISINNEVGAISDKKNADYFSFYKRFGALFLCALSFLLMCYILFWNGGTGLSDNGDFARVMNTGSLEYNETRVPFEYQKSFRMVFSGSNSIEKFCRLIFSVDNTQAYPSVHIVFIRLSELFNLAVNLLFGNQLSCYNIELLGIIYVLCYAVLLWLLFASFTLPKMWADVFVKLAFIFVLCDAGYVTYFNSFYSEPVQMIGLLGAMTFALRACLKKDAAVLNFLGFGFFAVIYGWSKFINIPVAVFALILLAAAVLHGLSSKKKLAVCSLSLAGVVVLVCVYLNVPQWMDFETNYNSVFFGVVKDTDSEKTAEYLSELGLPEYMAKYAGTNYYMSDELVSSVCSDETFRKDFTVDKADILFFYIRHPAYWFSRQSVALAHSGFVRPFYLSNYGKNMPRLTLTRRFAGWSALRERLPCGNWLFTTIVFSVALFALWLRLRQNSFKSLQIACIVLSVAFAAVYQFFMPVIANGEGDLAKHMFAFAEIMDFVALFLLAQMIIFACKHLKHPFPIAVGGLSAVILLGLCALPALRLVREAVPDSTIKPGSIVAFGKDASSNELIWQVCGNSANGLTIVLRNPAETLPFSDASAGEFGSNLWETSFLRNDLNVRFLSEAFSEDERALIKQTPHRVLLSGDYLSLKTSGKWDLFCFPLPEYCSRGIENAAAFTISDYIYLPDIQLASDMSANGFPLGCGDEIWLDTPYYLNSSMLRYVTSDGYILMRDASVSCGICPVINLKSCGFSGSGNLSDPFRIQ